MAAMAINKTDAKHIFLDEWERTGFAESDVTSEYIIPGKRYRYDIAFPSQKLVIEIHGFGFGHQRKAGLIRDTEKLNWATIHGYRVMAFTTAHLSSVEQRKRAIHDVCDVLSGRY